MADDNEQNQEHKKRRERSPNFPGIQLQTAVERARALYRAEGRSAAPTNVVLTHWGYSPKSSAGLITLGALRQFGLLDNQGSGSERTVKLTPLALQIVQDERADSPERDAAIRRAALTPQLHRELWKEYNGELPSDGNLRFQLVNKRAFTEGGANDFLQQFRATIRFSGLGASDRVKDEGNSEETDERGSDMSALVKPPVASGKIDPAPVPTHRIFNLPLSPSALAVLQVPSQMTERDWSQLLTILNAMKPGIISETNED